MKKILCLIDFEFKRSAISLMVISVSMVLAQIISFLFALSRSEYRYYRFEHLLELAAYPFLFSVFLTAVLLLTAFSFYQNFYGSKSIYTLMTLPGDRYDVYISKLLSGILSVLFIAATQIASVFFTYQIYLNSLLGVRKINNGLFLAFTRSKFLKTFLPLGIYPFLTSLIFTVSLVIMSIYIFVCLKKGERIKMSIVPVIVLWLIQFIYSIDQLAFDFKLVYFVIPLVLIVICTVFMICHSIKAIRSTKVL